MISQKAKRQKTLNGNLRYVECHNVEKTSNSLFDFSTKIGRNVKSIIIIFFWYFDIYQHILYNVKLQNDETKIAAMTNSRKENGQAKVSDRKEHRATPSW